ncbi:NAD-dependent epimerase/dehydratase family protein, partial [bacterium]
GCYDTLIHFSSSEVYGTSQRVSMSEDHPIRPTTPYAASKAASDMLIQSYHKSFGIDCSIIRPFNIYGPRQNMGSYAAIIPITIKRLLAGERPVVFGDGSQSRDFTYVTDVVRAAIDVYKQPDTRGLVVNIGSGEEVTVQQLVCLIREALGYNSPIMYKAARPGDVQRHMANSYLAKDLIDYSPSVPFDVGIVDTVQWYLKHRGD